MKNFQPFFDDDKSVGMQDLTLENQGEQVNLYGSATFTIDRQSLELAEDLSKIFNDIVSYLKQHNAQNIDRSQTLAEQQANVSEVANPFL